MNDEPQKVEPGELAEKLAGLIEKMLDEWPAGQKACKITLNMTFDQWGELLGALSSGHESST